MSERRGQGRPRTDEVRIDDRLLPHDLRAEAAWIGCALYGADLGGSLGYVRPERFFDPWHQAIVEAILAALEAGTPVDLITIESWLQARGKLALQPAGRDLASFDVAFATPALVEQYARLVHEAYLRRTLVEIHASGQIDARDGAKSSRELLAAVESRLSDLGEQFATQDVLPLAQVIPGVAAAIRHRQEHGRPIGGTPTGIPDLDTLLCGGLRAGQMIVLAARPAIGKTGVALSIAQHIAAVVGDPVLMISLEMGKDELGERLLSAAATVPGSKLKTGFPMTPLERRRFDAAEAALKDWPMELDDCPTRTMPEITALARRAKRKHPRLGLVIVDYLGLIEPEPGRESRQEQVAKLSRRLKTMARAIQTPVLVLAQLNRGVENREDKRPRLSDLRESGAIEQDSDTVILMHRPDYYDPEERPGVVELIVAKNRGGETGTVPVAFRRRFTRFETFDQVEAWLPQETPNRPAQPGDEPPPRPDVAARLARLK